MALALMILAALISIMFVASIASTITELRHEREDVRVYVKRHGSF